MILLGKTREQIASAIKNKTRGEVADIIYGLATLEPHFSAATIAASRGLSKRKVTELMRTGVIRCHRPLANGLRAPLSAIRDWDARTAVTLGDLS